MSWPFPLFYRPLMRSILWYQRYMGWGEGEIETMLTGPKHGFALADVQAAYREAMRSEYFADALRAASPDQTFGEVWSECAGSCFQRAYGREPTPAEARWAYSRPGDVLGLMYEITVPGAAGFRWTPTLNAAWDAKIGDTRDLVAEWFLAGLRSPPPPRSVESIMAAGAVPAVQIIGGALVPRIDPTLEMRRAR